MRDPATSDRGAVVVTGAASGIGRAVAGRCRRDGLFVVALDRDEDGLLSLGSQWGEGDGFVTAACDVSDPAAVSAVMASVGSEEPGLGAVVNVAGVGGSSGDAVATSLEGWDRTIAVNLSGVFYVSRAVIPHLRRRGGGRIVNVSSQFGLVGVAGSPAYAAAKAGVIGLTRAMAVDHAEEGILVNCVCPGPIDTPMLAASRSGQARGPGRREAERTAHRSLLGGPGRPEDVAGAISFLLGPDSAHITGTVLAVDGGWTAS